MFTVSKCCCCVDLRTGCYAVGTAVLVLDLASGAMGGTANLLIIIFG
jgi:hypothetical protein